MKSLFLIPFLFLSGLILGSSVGYIVEDVSLKVARKDLAAFEERALARAVERMAPRSIPVEQRASVPMPWSRTPVISRADREHIEKSRLQNQNLLYRRGLAGRLFVGGLLAATALVLLSAYRERQGPSQALQPTGAIVRG